MILLKKRFILGRNIDFNEKVVKIEVYETPNYTFQRGNL
jgi:hypothetical protein